MSEALAAAIATARAAHGVHAIERELFGDAAPSAIATELARASGAQLGAAIADCLFYAASSGCVAGVVLDDGRWVVLKVHAPFMRAPRLAACQAAQAELHARGFPCPAPLAGPIALGAGLMTIESHVAAGERADAHEPNVAEELATRLAELVRLLRARADGFGLGGSWFGALPDDRLWPAAEAARYGFSATAADADWIDELARRARAVPRAGERVVAHFDWRAEHARFAAGRMVAAYDWDSLHFEREPIAVGAAAHAFTAQWDRPEIRPAPSLDALRGFIAAYERARGRPFTADERRTAAASCLYSLAFTARREHAMRAGCSDTYATAFRTLLSGAAQALLAGT